MFVASVAHAQDADPWQWLEEVDGERALAWVDARSRAAEERLTKLPVYEPIYQRTLAILDDKSRIAVPTEMSGRWYNFWQDAEHPLGLWRRTTRESYRSGSPVWEVLLDVDALSKKDGKTWVFQGVNCLPPEHRRCLVSLSDGGTDAHVTREFDLATLDFVAADGPGRGFELPSAKSFAGWLDADTLLVGTDWGDGSLTTSGYPRTVRKWRRGTPWTAAEPVFEGRPEDVRTAGWADLTEGFHRTFVMRAPTFFTSETFAIVDGRTVKLDIPDDASAQPWREWLLIELRGAWTVGGTTYPAGSLLAAGYDDFLAGKRELRILFAPTERVSYQSWTGTRHHVVVRTLDNVRTRHLVLTPDARGGFDARPLGGLPENASLSVWPLDPEHGDELFVMGDDFLTPSTLWLTTAAPGAPPPAVIASAPAQFDASAFEVVQHEAVSDDGTRIPYFQVSRRGLPLDGTAPTLVNGYGGFEVPKTPAYSGMLGSAWLERGGVYVVANIRGGGEFGPAWHRAALRENRPKAYQDFAAVTKDLIARKVTSPRHLGAMGGSNGGLLMGNLAVGWPELFQAILCQVPLLDMKRYTKLLAGASWMEEYGDPDDPEQWAYIRTFSPYHLVKPGVRYPTIFFTTSTKDDRVHPGHARKMAAKMLDQGHPILYWENTQGGHAGAANNAQRAKMWSLQMAFLWDELGGR